MDIGKEVVVLNIDDVLPNRFQPRIKFNEKNILELADSIREHGVIQPIVVRKISDKYEIIAGERRYKASILAGKTTIPAIVTTFDDKQSAEVALIENIQRQDLTPIEEAISYKKILDMGYINQTDLAEKLGKTQSTVANKLRLLNLSDEVQEALLEGKISERHARSLLKLNNDKQVKLLDRIINERLTVRKTDEEIKKILNNPDEESTPKVIEKNIFEDPLIKEESKISNISDNSLKTELSVSSFFNGLNTQKEEKIKENPFINSFEELNKEKEKIEEIKPVDEFEIVELEENNQELNLDAENRIEGEIKMNQDNMFNPFMNNNQIQPENNQNNLFNNNPFNMPSTPIQENNMESNNNEMGFNNSGNMVTENSQPMMNNNINPMSMNENNDSQQGSQGGRFFNMFGEKEELNNNKDAISVQQQLPNQFVNSISNAESANPFLTTQNSIDVAEKPFTNSENVTIENGNPFMNNSQSPMQPTPFVNVTSNQVENQTAFANPINNVESTNPFLTAQNNIDIAEKPFTNSENVTIENSNPFMNNSQSTMQPTPFNDISINQQQTEIPVSNVNMGMNANPFAPQGMPNTPQMNNIDSQVSNNNVIENNSFSAIAPEQDLVNNQLKPFALDDDQKFVNQSSVELVSPNPFAKNEYTINEEPPVVVTPTEEPLPTKQADLRTVINTIRNCSETIENFGYIVDTEEIDFEDSYQVIFKIQK